MGNYLKKKIQEKGITQKEVALRLGVSQTTIGNWCRGKWIHKKGMGIYVAYELSKILNIPMEELIEGMMQE